LSLRAEQRETASYHWILVRNYRRKYESPLALQLVGLLDAVNQYLCQLAGCNPEVQRFRIANINPTPASMKASELGSGAAVEANDRSPPSIGPMRPHPGHEKVMRLLKECVPEVLSLISTVMLNPSKPKDCAAIVQL